MGQISVWGDEQVWRWKVGMLHSSVNALNVADVKTGAGAAILLHLAH